MTITFQRPTTGSKPWYGNFSFGLLVDSHPRFTNIILAFVLVEVVISFGEPNVNRGRRLAGGGTR